MRVPFAVVLIALVGCIAIGLGASSVVHALGASSHTAQVAGLVVVLALLGYVATSTDRGRTYHDDRHAGSRRRGE